MLLYSCDRCGQINVTREFLTKVTCNAFSSKYTNGVNNILPTCCDLCAKCVHELEITMKLFMKEKDVFTDIKLISNALVDITDKECCDYDHESECDKADEWLKILEGDENV